MKRRFVDRSRYDGAGVVSNVSHGMLAWIWIKEMHNSIFMYSIQMRYILL